MDKHIEVKSTPAANWRQEGKTDPHNTRYECQRVDLTMGQLTDDEIANAVFLCDHRTSFDSIVYLTAAKDRIRWLSRSNEALIAQLEAAQKERDDLLNQEFQQRLANAEHQLYMKDLAIHNIKASRKAQFRKRLAAEAALSAANMKLSKPVVLPDDGLEDCINMWPDNWRNDFDTGYNFGIWRCEQNIKAAGFTVEGNADAE
ncbi:TPA: hypothetical protein ACX4EX_001608 [Yersinia enterocolitica]|uniref:hypothetical protein n=1 Tax=Yersinia enterocolitica TaxID=630 RepID=UPI0005FCEE0F|nr:hypothetical protein [Yersinia enterocolitica]EKN5933463.1 hypothetical protein [Yersinia enterocolitica]CRE93558.1 Uncharacterised protein [Yersinia enterocolitica]